MAGRFPLYSMVVNGSLKWVTIYEAGRLYDSGWCQVDFGEDVIEEDGTTRKITDAEKKRISDLADEYSESK